MLQNTWCDVCGKADLGMSEPQEYEEEKDLYYGYLQSLRKQSSF